MHDIQVLADGAAAMVLAQASLLALWDSVWPYLLMILGFSAIVFVHELGHFLVAKWADVRVERFAIGFGREIVGFTWGETRYSFNILPLGGYVKMLGQEDFDDKSNELQFSDDPRSFINKPVGHRMGVVSAGVVMNVLFACLLFAVVFKVGMLAPGTRIGYVDPDSPADKAGLLPGDKILRINDEPIHEFRDVSMAVQLAAPHEPIEFVVEREGEALKPIYVKPDYRRPENTREARRQIIGIMPGVTREIVWVGPDVDSDRPDQPHIGDTIVEIDGVPVVAGNVNALRDMPVYAKEVYVERKDPKNASAPPQRVRVTVSPQLAVYPADSRDPDSLSILGLTPLARFGAVDLEGRAALAGIEVGDTIVSWDDIPHPNRADISRAISDLAEWDIPFQVRKRDGRLYSGFVRPKRNRVGPATIQAGVSPIPMPERKPDGPQARFTNVRRFGLAEAAGIQSGDIIWRVDKTPTPTAAALLRTIRSATGQELTLDIEKPDGRRVVARVTTQEPGSIDANYTLIADDVLQTGEIVEAINDRPSPAVVAGIPAGATITAADGEAVSTWVELIAAFRRHAGGTVDLSYTTATGQLRTAPFPVPNCMRTLLGVGPEARIVSVDNRHTVVTRTSRGEEEVHVGHHEGTRSLLASLVGQEKVPVTYRTTPVAAPQTAYINVTADMVDPWLSRIVFAPKFLVGDEMIPLKGETLFEAVDIGLRKTWYFIIQVYETMNRMIFSRTVGVENLSGPLGILSAGGQVVRMGFVEFLFFMAIISANLAVINFLPLPIVDGGLMVFLIIEWIKGSPVSLKVQVATQVIGLFLIIGAFLFVTYNDVIRIWG
ncbi:MAG: RIP metalloprotease RseP [Planctomycetes bacterium]|nr:RIP metalloprotease RseP [Planctomycetota bacterium]